MKEIFSTYVSVALAGIAGNVLYVQTLGDPTDYHWLRSFVFSAFFAAAWVLLRKYRQKHLPH
jgi:hypothetical protein